MQTAAVKGRLADYARRAGNKGNAVEENGEVDNVYVMTLFTCDCRTTATLPILY
jgi:hypothetical protein